MCLNCGKKFRKPICRIKSGRIKFCSKVCYTNSKKSFNKICPICKKSFRVKQSQVKTSRGKYCSRNCFASSEKGKHRSFKTEFKKGYPKPINAYKFPKREKHWNWNNGRFKTTKSYVLILKPEHPFPNHSGGYVFEHRLIIEEYLGRYLFPKEVVHHINGIRDDNRIENLKLMTDSEHKSFHSNRQ
jgi:hypothetical protein